MSTALIKRENSIIKDNSPKKKISPFLKKLYNILQVSKNHNNKLKF
jgi:hypothetical protein